MNWDKFVEYLTARAKETSTWQALIVVATAFGAHFTEDQKAAVLAVGLAIAGILSAIFPDRLGSTQSRATDKPEDKQP